MAARLPAGALLERSGPPLTPHNHLAAIERVGAFRQLVAFEEELSA